MSDILFVLSFIFLGTTLMTLTVHNIFVVANNQIRIALSTQSHNIRKPTGWSENHATKLQYLDHGTRNGYVNLHRYSKTSIDWHFCSNADKRHNQLCTSLHLVFACQLPRVLHLSFGLLEQQENIKLFYVYGFNPITCIWCNQMLWPVVPIFARCYGTVLRLSKLER